ncbi:MAG: hypothetical protein AUK03_12580 [Anaerolineae bacterium CG2_30_64_16]|nr:MAG: hypothetical protein AUK03_12580 [Anaerolineae bacterium CG2_30_64_16]
MAKMIIMVLDDVDKLQDVMAAWQAAGAAGITILESSGAGRLSQMGARDDLPLFPGLHSLLWRQEIQHRTLFTVVDDDVDIEALFDATEAIVGSLTDPYTGIIMALPVIAVRGGGKPANGAPENG